MKELSNILKMKLKKIIKENILISAHGNSIRALCKYLFNLDNNQISSLRNTYWKSFNN